MSAGLGIHFGSHTITAVALDRKGEIADVLTIDRVAEKNTGGYSEQEMVGVIERIQNHFNIKRHTIALSLPGSDFYFRRVAFDVRRGKAEAARYAVEPLIPVPIENAHVVIQDSDSTTAGIIVVPLYPWKRLLELIDQAGWICPLAVGDALSVWRTLAGANGSEPQLRMLCISEPREGAIVASIGDRILAIRHFFSGSTNVGGDRLEWLTSEISRVAWFCGKRDDQYKTHIVHVHEDKEQQPISDRSSAITIHSIKDVLPGSPSHTIGALFAFCAARNLRVGKKKVGNLRRGELVSSTIRARDRRCWFVHSLAASLLMVGTAFGMVLYGQQCRNQKAAYQNTGVGIWKAVFPTKPPPREIEFRLRSELVREQGLRKENVTLPESFRALDLLRQIVSSLPGNIPVRIRQIDLGGKGSTILGEARSHGEVEHIANRLARIKGILVLPATTERTNEVVRFTLRLEKKESPDDSKDLSGSPSKSIGSLCSRDTISLGVGFSAGGVALATQPGSITSSMATKDSSLCAVGGRYLVSSDPSQAGGRTSGQLSYVGGIFGASGPKSRDEPRPNKDNSAGISSSIERLSLRGDLYPGSINRNDNGGYGETSVELTKRISRTSDS